GRRKASPLPPPSPPPPPPGPGRPPPLPPPRRDDAVPRRDQDRPPPLQLQVGQLELSRPPLGLLAGALLGQLLGPHGVLLLPQGQGLAQHVHPAFLQRHAGPLELFLGRPPPAVGLDQVRRRGRPPGH